MSSLVHLPESLSIFCQTLVCKKKIDDVFGKDLLVVVQVILKLKVLAFREAVKNFYICSNMGEGGLKKTYLRK